MRSNRAVLAIATLCLLLAALAGEAGAQTPAPPRPWPQDESKAAQAGRQASSSAQAGTAAETIGPAQFTTVRVFATQYNPNTAGSVEAAVPDKCAKFAALANTSALSSQGCPSGYRLGLDYRVAVARDNGQSAVIPVKDAGPWNLDDDYWDFGGSSRPRRRFADLGPGVPEASAAFSNGYNSSPNCLTLGNQPSGHSGGADQFGRCVLNPAGLDLSVEAAKQLGLGNLQNEWVTVAFLWAPVRNNLSSVNSGKNVDVYGASQADGARVIQWPNNGGANQQWRFEAVGPGVYRIVSVNSGKVLDVYGGSTDDGTPVIQWPWNGGANQQWRFEVVGPGAYRLVSVKSGKVLDVYGASPDDGAPLIQWPWHGGANQQWRINQVGNN
ncbi:MAG: RICIN domain-containing protein [Acidimicrobiales bacterium]